jgi:GT2 family glycosyltransferase
MSDQPPTIGRGRVVAASRRRLEDPARAGEFLLGQFRVQEGVFSQPHWSPVPSELRPGLTVAVCTYRRPASIVRFFESLLCQEPGADQFVVVDASPDGETEEALRVHLEHRPAPGRIDYLRVGGPLRGLTPQRNVALYVAAHRLTAFFDDDIVLLPNCLGAMAAAHAQQGSVVGVGAVIQNECSTPTALWRVRRALGIVPTLRPGHYTRSGFQIPWHFLPETSDLVDGEWLPGGATMWRTEVARSVGFHEGLDGYASGEDLEFSVQMQRHGRLVTAGSARLLHLHDANARPDQVQMGYMGLRNLFYIHQQRYKPGLGLDTLYFMYGYGLDTLVRLVALVKPGSVRLRWHFIRGRLRFFREFAGLAGTRRSVT